MMLKSQILIAGAQRTPIGTFGGAFAEVPAPKLGAAAIKAAFVPVTHTLRIEAQ